MKRIKFKRKKKHKKINLLFLTIVFAICLSIFFIYLIDKKITPVLLRYATVETKRFSTILINQAIDDEVIELMDDNSLFTVTKSSSDEIQMVDFNTKRVNEVLEFINKKIGQKLTSLEKGEINDLNFVDSFKGVNFDKLKKGVVCEVPAGIIISSSLLSNMGPLIPVKLSFIGQVTTNLKTKVKNYGINNAYVEVSVHVEVTQKITMPISTEEVPVSLDIPLTVKMIQGKVPSFFSNASGENSNLFSLPTNE